MLKLNPLYSQGENDKVLVWEIEVEDNKYRTISGAMGYKLVTSAWTTCEGKNVGKANGTTGETQAEAEALALWKKKAKHGYFEDVKDIGKSNYIEPMLANKFEDHKHKIKYPVIVDAKFNGMRMIATKDGIKTRKGEPVLTIPHIVKALEPVFKKFPDAIFDGESYNQMYTFKLNELIKLVRKSKKYTEQDLIESEKIVKYYVYDGFNCGCNESDKCSVRRKAIAEALKDIPYVVIVSGQIANNEEEVREIYAEHVANNMEGAIVRSDTGYERKRTNALLKVKPVDDSEGEIIDIIQGTGNWEGAAKIVTLKWEGKVFNSSVKGTYEKGVEILKNKDKWIGKVVTFTYNGITGKGVPNFSQVDFFNCLKGDR